MHDHSKIKKEIIYIVNVVLNDNFTISKDPTDDNMTIATYKFDDVKFRYCVATACKENYVLVTGSNPNNELANALMELIYKVYNQPIIIAFYDLLKIDEIVHRYLPALEKLIDNNKELLEHHKHLPTYAMLLEKVDTIVSQYESEDHERYQELSTSDW